MDIPAPDPQDLIHLLINIATHQLTITQDIRAVLHELPGPLTMSKWRLTSGSKNSSRACCPLRPTGTRGTMETIRHDIRRQFRHIYWMLTIEMLLKVWIFFLI